jgi:drug/metabolite transporter (DMT)-like permease
VPSTESAAARLAPALVAAMPAVFVLLWSTGFVVARYAAPHAPPLTFLLWRFGAVVLVLLPLVALSAAPWPRNPAGWLHVAVAGVLLQATYLGGVWWSIAEGMPAAASALIVGLQPLLTAGAGGVVGERISARQWTGLVLGFGGVALVLSDRLTLQGVGTMPLLANLLALAGITAGTLYQKRYCTGIDLRTGSVIQFGAAFVVTLPFVAASGRWQVDFVAEFWLALGWSVLVLSLVAMALLLTMIRRGRATEVASLMYLTPPATALLAWALFGEALGPRSWLGVLITMGGVALALRSGRKGGKT